MAYRAYNPNPDGKRVGDCTVRAISAATGKRYILALRSKALRCMICPLQIVCGGATCGGLASTGLH